MWFDIIKIDKESQLIDAIGNEYFLYDNEEASKLWHGLIVNELIFGITRTDLRIKLKRLLSKLKGNSLGLEKTRFINAICLLGIQGYIKKYNIKIPPPILKGFDISHFKIGTSRFHKKEKTLFCDYRWELDKPHEDKTIDGQFSFVLFYFGYSIALYTYTENCINKTCFF